MIKLVVKLAVFSGLLALVAGPVSAKAHAGELVWSGDVDDTVIVYVHQDNVLVKTIHGKDTQNINVDFEGRLSRDAEQVYITDWTGRGFVKLIRQPDPYNHFTAAILIRDPEPGRSHYTFTLNWHPINFGAPAPGY